MLTIPALKLQQFNQEFFLLNLAAGDVERLVRFEVLGDPGVQGKCARVAKVNWAKRRGAARGPASSKHCGSNQTVVG